MTSKEFIGKCVAGEIKPSKDDRRYNSSIMWDGETVYSYGYHYPLLFKVGDVWVLNDRGYSNTTGKHISWAGSFADYRVNLLAGKSYKPRAADIIESVNAEIVQLNIMIERTLESEIKRPKFAATYQQNIARYEARIQQLNELAILCTK